MKFSRFGFLLTLLTVFGTLSGAGCSTEKSAMEGQLMNALNELSEHDMAELARTRIYFGHQSVGQNILDGIQQLAVNYPDLGLNLVHLDADSGADDIWSRLPAEGWFADSYIGSNSDPAAKNHDFAGMLGRLPIVDFAFAKYCYLDIGPQSDVHTIFRDYQETLERLRAEYPATTFIHVTAPLTILQRGPKAWVKKLLGRDISGHSDNIKRHEYNELLRQRYQGKEPLFDLAQLESTRPDGSRMTFEEGGQTYYALVPEYTPDDGHLNAGAQRYIAAKLLGFLAAVVERRSPAGTGHESGGGSL